MLSWYFRYVYSIDCDVTESSSYNDTESATETIDFRGGLEGF